MTDIDGVRIPASPAEYEIVFNRSRMFFVLYSINLVDEPQGTNGSLSLFMNPHHIRLHSPSPSPCSLL